MKLEELYDLWEKDAKYDDLNLDVDSLNIASLHAKYNRMLSEARSQLRALRINRKSHYATLREYYLGNLNNPEDLDRIGREPYLNKVLRQNVQDYVEADDDIVKIDTRIAVLEEKVEVIVEIMKCIHKRSFDIKHAIEWRKFTQGF